MTPSPKPGAGCSLESTSVTSVGKKSSVEERDYSCGCYPQWHSIKLGWNKNLDSVLALNFSGFRALLYL